MRMTVQRRTSRLSALAAALALALSSQALQAQQDTVKKDEAQPETIKRADFGPEDASPEARKVADWVVNSGDSKALPFVIIDKVAARVYVFEPDGKLRGAAPALLGIAKGDHTLPGIANLPLGRIKVSDRTTPAGRFEAALGVNASGKDILWVDYDSALSLHRVATGNAKERRAQRLATPTVADNRISFGCINVPVPFYEKVVSPSFKGTSGVVYVLPEVRPLKEVFSALP
jgi:hypothetical protein